jgi:hypothetical protein
MDLDSRETLANEGLVLAMVDVLRQPPGNEVPAAPTRVMLPLWCCLTSAWCRCSNRHTLSGFGVSTFQQVVAACSDRHDSAVGSGAVPNTNPKVQGCCLGRSRVQIIQPECNVYDGRPLMVVSRSRGRLARWAAGSASPRVACGSTRTGCSTTCTQPPAAPSPRFGEPLAACCLHGSRYQQYQTWLAPGMFMCTLYG